MILQSNSDAAYLVAPEAQSRAAGWIPLPRIEGSQKI